MGGLYENGAVDAWLSEGLIAAKRCEGVVRRWRDAEHGAQAGELVRFKRARFRPYAGHPHTVVVQAEPCDLPGVTHCEPTGDRLTAASIGVLAGTLAATAHEVVGHGAGCLADGGRITLLTSIYFKCAGATWLTDGAGPVASLAFGLISLAALGAVAHSGWLRFFLLVSALICLGWFAGQAIYSGASNKDDWAFVARSLHWPPLWRLFAVAAGLGVYIWAARVLARRIKPGDLAIALATATASAAVAGLLWIKAPIQGAVEGAAAVGVAPMLLLLLMWRRREEIERPAPRGARSWPWVAFAAVTYGLFLVGPSRGFGPLS